jgi:hypothetical protein
VANDLRGVITGRIDPPKLAVMGGPCLLSHLSEKFVYFRKVTNKQKPRNYKVRAALATTWTCIQHSPIIIMFEIVNKNL